MLHIGAPIPAVHVWASALEEPVPLSEAIAGDGHALLCFYAFDFSPG